MMREWLGSVTPDDEPLVANYMRRLVNASQDERPRMPDAAVLWVKAQMLRRWEAERKAQAPLDVMEPVQIAAGVAAAAILLVWSLPSLLRIVRGLLPG